MSPYDYIKEHSITLDRYDFGEIRGSCMRMGDHSYIGVMRGLPEIEEKEIIAHEIGHLEDGTDKMVGVLLAERRADKIARELLISKSDLIKAIEDEEGTCDTHSLARKFGVSIETMQKRIRDIFNH